MLGMGVPLRSGGNRQDFVLGRKPMLIGLAVDAAVRGPDLVRSLANAVFQSSEIAPRAMPGLGINGMHSEPPFTKQDDKASLSQAAKISPSRNS
jgi:hypothetical protein